MPPAKSSRNHDDSKVESGGAKEKNGGHSSTKMRRIISQTGSAHSRESKAAVAPTSAPTTQSAVVEIVAPTLQWLSFDRDVLHAYRREHRIDTPASYVSSYHETVLSQAGGIGQYSPTMLRKRKARRQTKEKLAMAVRKHFNGRGIQENDVIVDMLHKIGVEKAAKATGGPHRSSSFAVD